MEAKRLYIDYTFQVLPMEVHLNIDQMPNILVIKDVASIPGIHIIMDSRNKREIIVEYQNRIISFQECRYGLYYYDTTNKYTPQINSCYF